MHPDPDAGEGGERRAGCGAASNGLREGQRLKGPVIAFQLPTGFLGDLGARHDVSESPSSSCLSSGFCGDL